MTTSTNALGFGASVFGAQFTDRSIEASKFCKDVIQGLLSALMLIAGSTSLTAGEALAAAIPAGFEGSALEAVFSGRVMGAMEIAVAVLLFIATRRGIARTLGVMALIAYVAAHGSGLTAADIASATSALLTMLAERLDSVALMAGMA